MRKPIILGLVGLGAMACFALGCSSSKSNGGAAGGTGSNGGATSTGGANPSSGGSTSTADGGATGGASCEATVQYDVDGGVIQYGASDPTKSVTLDVGGFYSQSADFHGYCFTVSDSTDDNMTGGTSKFDPPCGKTGPCFTVASGLCATAQIDKANGAISWGGGIGCNLAQEQGGSNTFVGVTGKTTMTISVSCCKPPSTLQMQLNVGNPPFDADAGKYGSGYFCKIVTLSAPDSSGVRTATLNLSDLRQDCWDPGGAAFDASSMLVTAMQAQISAVDSGPTDWDFCISKWTID